MTPTASILRFSLLAEILRKLSPNFTPNNKNAKQVFVKALFGKGADA